MKRDWLLNAIFQADILRVAGENELTVDEGFVKAVEDRQQRLRDGDERVIRSELASVDISKAALERFIKVTATDPDFVARYLTIRNQSADLPHEAAMAAIPALDQFDDSVRRGEGVPEGFLATNGERLLTLLKFFPQMVVYVWREDCKPCDYMRRIFEDIRSDVPDEITLLAVYGPGDPELLYEEFDIGGAPTTLFMVDGYPDARIVGPTHPETVRAEVNAIRDT